MPTIVKLQSRKQEGENQRNEHTPERELRKELYNTTLWRKARLFHLKSEPLCQECLREGTVYAGTGGNSLQVHHIKSPFQNGKINWDLALDQNNLETIYKPFGLFFWR